MKILVPIKSVIDQNKPIRISSDNSEIDTSDFDVTINYYCQRALEEALRIKEAGKASEIVVLTLGAEKDKKILFQALAMGADRAIFIKTEEKLQNLIIAKAVKEIALKENPKIIISGKKSIDRDSSQTGQMIAGLLGWGQATSAINIEFTNDSLIKVTREINRGNELIELKLPCVITADYNLNSPRKISDEDIEKAKQSSSIEELNIKDFNIDLSARSSVIRTDMNPRKSLRKEVKTVEELVQILREEAKVI